MLTSRISFRRVAWPSLIAGLALASCAGIAAAAELLASSSDDAPGAPWQAFAVSGAGSAFTREGGALRLSLARGDRATCAIAVPPEARDAMICRFNLTVTGSNAIRGNALVLRVGSGFAGGNVDDSNLSTYGRLGIVGTGSGFRLRDSESGRTGPVFEGTQAVTWAVNRSGHSIAYAAPNGGTEMIASGHMDAWIGRAKVFGGLTVTNSTVAMTDVKGYWSGAGGTTLLDRFAVEPLTDAATEAAPAAPDPVTIAAASEAASDGTQLELYRPSPNPFERTTRFAYAITAGTEQVDIGVFDLAGRRIRSLASGPRSVGRYEVAWDGRTDSGSRVRNGVYFLRAFMGTELKLARITYLVK